MTTVVIPLTPSKPGPSASYEDITADDLRLRQIADLVIQGHSYRQIAKDLGIAYTTVQRLAPKVSALINEETRAIVAMWQAAAFARLESVISRLLPHIMRDERADDPDDPGQAEAAALNALPPDPKLVAMFAKLTMTTASVLTLSRQKIQLPDAIAAADDDQAAEKARLVNRFIELANLVDGIVDGTIGGGRTPEEDEEDFDRLHERADNSGTIDDAITCDDDDEGDDDLDAVPGEWRDGKFYPLRGATFQGPAQAVSRP